MEHTLERIWVSHLLWQVAAIYEELATFSKVHGMEGKNSPYCTLNFCETRTSNFRIELFKFTSKVVHYMGGVTSTLP
jgi:hypothetical protein